MSKQAHQADNTTQKVVSIFSRQQEKARILRLVPEFDGTEILYANDRHPDTLFSLKALAWAKHEDGSIHALVPWLHNLVAEEELSDPLNGHWEGFRLAKGNILFAQPPEYKVAALEAALYYFGNNPEITRTDNPGVIQEIPDTIGTHGVITDTDGISLYLLEIVSWQLLSNGKVRAMVADENRVMDTPVLPGSDCLVPLEEMPGFRYFFQHGIANRIKEHDPDTLAALALLVEENQGIS